MLKAGRPSVKKEKALKLVSGQKQLVKTNINMEKSFHKKILIIQQRILFKVLDFWNIICKNTNTLV